MNKGMTNSQLLEHACALRERGKWTLRFFQTIVIARQCRCQGECCSGVEQCVRDVI